jgi:transcriptional regulator with XRE-family HTH domain
MPRKRFPGCDGEDFRVARLHAGRSQAEVAGLLRVTRRTVRNWESGRSQVPYSAFKLMRIMTGYALPGEAWRGWCLRDGVLWSPTGRAFEAWGMGYLSLVFGMAREFLRGRGLSGRMPLDKAFNIPRVVSRSARSALKSDRLPIDRTPQQPPVYPGPGRADDGAAVEHLLRAPLARPLDDGCIPALRPRERRLHVRAVRSDKKVRQVELGRVGEGRAWVRTPRVSGRELTGVGVVDTLARPLCLANVSVKRNGSRSAAAVRDERCYTLCECDAGQVPDQVGVSGR